MKPLVLIGLPAVRSEIRVELAAFIAHACVWQAINPDKVENVILRPEKMVPTPVARNRLVKIAQERKADFLLMVDDDTCPPADFFAKAVEFLMSHPVSAIGTPYVTGPGDMEEAVLVFEMTSKQSGTKDTPWKLSRIPREDAARRTGVQKVANIGTGCIMYDMEVFKRIKTPYYDYSYNQDHTEVEETEDCAAHRRMHFEGVGFYVSWDHWAVHQKIKACYKPTALTEEHIQDMYLRQARAELGPKIRKEVEDQFREEIRKAEDAVVARRNAIDVLVPPMGKPSLPSMSGTCSPTVFHTTGESKYRDSPSRDPHNSEAWQNWIASVSTEKKDSPVTDATVGGEAKS